MESPTRYKAMNSARPIEPETNENERPTHLSNRCRIQFVMNFNLVVAHGGGDSHETRVQYVRKRVNYVPKKIIYREKKVNAFMRPTKKRPMLQMHPKMSLSCETE